eukprot:1294661-Lingulodinium_polyedra.AAC.1
MGSYPRFHRTVLAVPPMPALRRIVWTGPNFPPMQATTFLPVTSAPATFIAQSGRYHPARTPRNHS